MSRSTSVVLPAPDGAETMKRRPRDPLTDPLPVSLDILHLLAQLLELGLRRDDELGYAEAIGFRPHRIHLAVHLLQQKVELPPARLGAVRQRDPVRHVTPKPRNLFADIGTRCDPNDLLPDRRLVRLERRPQLADALHQP